MSRKKWFWILISAFFPLFPPAVNAQFLIESDEVIGTLLSHDVVLFNRDVGQIEEVTYFVSTPGGREHLIYLLAPGGSYNVYRNGQQLSGSPFRASLGGTLRFYSDKDGTFCVTQGVPPPDTAPPFVFDHLPQPGASDVPLATDIVVHVGDNESGVDISTLAMAVEGNTVTPTISGDANHYVLRYDPPTDFDFAQVVNVVIEAQDMATPPNVMGPESFSFITQAPPDTAAPQISEITCTRVTTTRATIEWKTDEPSNSRIEYGTTSGYGRLSPLVPQLVMHHGVDLTDLMPGTTYHFRVLSADSAGNIASSGDCSFTTDSSVSITEEWGDGLYSDHQGTCFDTYIDVGAKNTNYSDNTTTLNTYTWPTNAIANAILLKWDLSAIPNVATVMEAQLHLYLCRAGGDNSYEIPVHKVINVNPIIAACTWNTYDGENPWTGGHNGGQNDIAPAEVTLSVDAVVDEYKIWTVTDMVSDWVRDPANNYGMMVNSDDNASSDSWRYFTPSENEHQERRPRLIITYIDNSGREEAEDITEPEFFALARNYPNPFNATTVIPYRLHSSVEGHAALKIYNLLGQLVRTLVDGVQPPGYHEVVWDGRDDRGNEMSSGIYVYQLRAGGSIASGKAALLR